MPEPQILVKSIVDVPVPQIQEKIVEVIKVILQEQCQRKRFFFTPSWTSVPLPARVPLPDALDHARGTLEHDRRDRRDRRGHARARW